MTRIRVEFTGGPYCGHTQTVAQGDDLNERVELPVSKNVYLMLDRKPAGPGWEDFTSIAVYKLEWRGEVAVYRHFRSYRPGREIDCGAADELFADLDSGGMA